MDAVPAELLPLDKVSPGAVLAADVKDAKGNMLVGEGRILTEEWIKRLQGRSITHVKVRAVGDSSSVAPSVAPAGNDRRLKRLEAMFSKVAAEPLMQALAASARQILEERRT